MRPIRFDTWKEIVKVAEPKKKPLFISIEEMTMAEWTSFENMEKKRKGRA